MYELYMTTCTITLCMFSARHGSDYRAVGYLWILSGSYVNHFIECFLTSLCPGICVFGPGVVQCVWLLGALYGTHIKRCIWFWVCSTLIVKFLWRWSVSVWVLQVEVGFLMRLLERGMKGEVNNFMRYVFF